MAPSDIERGLHSLEAELKRLETEYNMFFAGRLPKPPWETRRRVESLVKQYDRSYIANYADRFRFSTLQARYAAFIDLWDRALRAREEGRPGPLSQARRDGARAPADRIADRILHVAAFRDPMKELSKLQDLYVAIADARRDLGEQAVPFHKFVELVKTEVEKLKASGSPEVAFRVAIKNGKVSFTARALKGVSDG